MIYQVRELQREDLQPGNGFLDTLSNLTEVSPLNPEERLAIFEKVKQEGSTIFVAISEENSSQGQVIGTVKLMLDQKFFRGGAVAAHLEDFVVRKGFEGHGIARTMWLTFLEKCREIGCYKIILDCANDLVPFYKKLGFYEFEITMRITP